MIEYAKYRSRYASRIEYGANKIINYYKENEEFKNIPYHKAEVFDNTLILYKKEKKLILNMV